MKIKCKCEQILNGVLIETDDGIRHFESFDIALEFIIDDLKDLYRGSHRFDWDGKFTVFFSVSGLPNDAQDALAEPLDLLMQRLSIIIDSAAEQGIPPLAYLTQVALDLGADMAMLDVLQQAGLEHLNQLATGVCNDL